MSAHFNGLTPAASERLAILAEECGEVIMAVCKILRHGWESRNPTLAAGPTNRQELAKEIGHVLHAMDRIQDAGDLPSLAIEAAKDHKAKTIGRWLHHVKAGQP